MVMASYKQVLKQMYRQPHLALAWGLELACLADSLQFSKGLYYGIWVQAHYYAQLGDWRRSRDIGLEALALAQSLDEPRFVQKSYQEIANACGKLQDPEAGRYFALSLALADSNGRDVERMQARYAMARWLHEQGADTEAMPLLQEGISLAGELQDNLSLSILLNLSAVMWGAMGEHERSIETLHQAIRIRKTRGPGTNLAFLWMTLGGQYFLLGNLDSARWYMEKALPQFEQIQNLPGLAALHNNLSQIYEKTERLPEAKAHLREALRIHERMQDPVAKITAQINLGEMDLRNGQHKQGLNGLNSARREAEQNGNPTLRRSARRALYLAHESLGNFERAFHYRSLYHALKDSMVNAESLAAIAEIEARYENEKKGKEIVALQEAKLSQDLTLLQIQWQKKRLTGLIGVLLLVLTLALAVGWWLIQRQQLRRDQETAELQQRLLRSQMNPHFIFNALNSIQRLYQDEEIELADAYVADLGELLKAILEQSGQKSISLRQELQTLQRYLRMEQYRLEDHFQYQIQVAADIDPDQVNVPPLILQPLVENAIWHGLMPQQGKGTLNLHIFREGDMLHFQVQDNGIGLTRAAALRAEVHKPKALQILQERLHSAARFSISERTDTQGEILGTEARLQIPVRWT